MNKKLNITAAEYQHRARQQAKERTKRFREEQERRGYKNLTVYLSEPFRHELERLSTDQGLNRQAAMDHIFDVYQQNINSDVTSNAINKSDKTVETPVSVEPLGEPAEKVTEIDLPEPDTKATVKPSPVETQREIPIIEPESPDQENMQKPARPFNKAEICKIVVNLRDQGMSYQSIADELKRMGYTPKGKGKESFHHSTISKYYKDGKK